MHSLGDVRHPVAGWVSLSGAVCRLGGLTQSCCCSLSFLMHSLGDVRHPVAPFPCLGPFAGWEG